MSLPVLRSENFSHSTIGLSSWRARRGATIRSECEGAKFRVIHAHETEKKHTSHLKSLWILFEINTPGKVVEEHFCSELRCRAVWFKFNSEPNDLKNFKKRKKLSQAVCIYVRVVAWISDYVGHHVAQLHLSSLLPKTGYGCGFFKIYLSLFFLSGEEGGCNNILDKMKRERKCFQIKCPREIQPTADYPAVRTACSWSSNFRFKRRKFALNRIYRGTIPKRTT